MTPRWKPNICWTRFWFCCLCFCVGGRIFAGRIVSLNVLAQLTSARHAAFDAKQIRQPFPVVIGYSDKLLPCIVCRSSATILKNWSISDDGLTTKNGRNSRALEVESLAKSSVQNACCVRPDQPELTGPTVRDSPLRRWRSPY